MGPDRRQDYVTFHCDMTYDEILEYERLNNRTEYSIYNGDTTVYSYSANCSKNQ
jgi:L-rhamnose mutarotase